MFGARNHKYLKCVYFWTILRKQLQSRLFFRVTMVMDVVSVSDGEAVSQSRYCGDGTRRLVKVG